MLQMKFASSACVRVFMQPSVHVPLPPRRELSLSPSPHRCAIADRMAAGNCALNASIALRPERGRTSSATIRYRQDATTGPDWRRNLQTKGLPYRLVALARRC